MKGNFHIPVIAFVIGGGLSYISGYGFYLLLGVLIYWLYLFRNTWPWMLCVIFFCSFGYVYLAPASPPPVSTSLINGMITSPVKETPASIQVTLTLHNSEEKTLITYIKDQEQELKAVPDSWQHGASCEVEGKKSNLNEASNPGQFSYREYMEQQGVYTQVLIDSTVSLTCHGRSKLSYAYQWRKQIMNHVRRSVTPESYSWMAALIFGDSDSIEEGTISWFRDFSLSHLLAISGLHVGLTIGLVFFILYRSGLATIEQAKSTIMALLPIYCFLAGAAPSVIRSTLMALLFLVFSHMKIRTSISDILSLVAFVFLLASPSHLTHIGFQFSFLVTISLLFSIPLLSNYRNVWVQSAIISFVSQLSILPIQVHYFYEFNPLSLVANVLLVPYFSFIVIPVFMFLLLLCIILPQFAYQISQWMTPLHEGLLDMLKENSQLLNLQWTIGEISIEWMFLYFIFFISMMRLWSRGQLNRAFISGVLSVLTISAFSISPYLSSQGIVTMLDVGQGDAFVIELPYRRGVVMIDAAGPPFYNKNPDQIADQVILPYLKSRGISNVDALMISHKDTDHSGSVQALLEELDVGRIIVSSYYSLENKMDTTEIIRVQANDEVVVGEQSFMVLHPNRDWKDPNDNSLVVTSSIGGLRWLFTGDISAEVEKNLVEEFPYIQADVLKVGHHGSNTSTSEVWLERINPLFSLISAGRNNRYGHPHQEVLERLKGNEGTVFQTNTHGSVQFKFSKGSGTFSRFLPYNASRE